MTALILAAAKVKEISEPNKTAFFIAGGVLVAWALSVTFYGLRTPDWPSTVRTQRVVIAVSALLVAAAMISAVATS